MGIMSFENDAFKGLEEVAKVDHVVPDRIKLFEHIDRYDAYFCSLRIPVTRDIIDRGKRLLAIATPSTGLDHIEVGYATQKGIKVLSLKEEYKVLRQIPSTAEMVWALLLGVIRKIPWSFDAVKCGNWVANDFRGNQLQGKVLGILGYGRLGKMVAEYAKAFRMQIIACDKKPIQANDVQQVSFTELLSRSAIISIHIHLTPETTHMINEQAFERMQEGVIIINTSRGAVIDEKALLNALRSGRVKAAGLDVIDGEFDADLVNHPLIQYAREHENLLISPHVGGTTREAQLIAYEHTANILAAYLRNL